MPDLGPYPPLLPWALVGLVAAIGLALDPPSLTAWDPFDRVTDHERAVQEPVLALRQTRADLVMLGDSRLGSALSATPLDGWLRGCGVVAEAPLGLYVPQLDFSAIGANTPRLRALGPDTVVLQLDLFAVIAPADAGEEALRRVAARDRAAFTLGRDFVTAMGAVGARVAVVELPRSASKWAEYGPEALARWAEVRQRLRALGVALLQPEGPWEDSLFTDGVHFNALGAARARAWICNALPGLLSDDAPTQR